MTNHDHDEKVKALVEDLFDYLKRHKVEEGIAAEAMAVVIASIIGAIASDAADAQQASALLPEQSAVPSRKSMTTRSGLSDEHAR